MTSILTESEVENAALAQIESVDLSVGHSTEITPILLSWNQLITTKFYSLSL